MTRHVTFEVLGQKYSLYTEASDADVQEILGMVKSRIEAQAGGGANVLPSIKAAVLASLNVASEYVELKKDYVRYKQDMDGNIERLIDKIDRSLYQE